MAESAHSCQYFWRRGKYLENSQMKSNSLRTKIIHIRLKFTGSDEVTQDISQLLENSILQIAAMEVEERITNFEAKYTESDPNSQIRD